MASHTDLDLLIRYHTGELPEAERARVTAHLDGCEPCRRDALCLEAALQPSGDAPPAGCSLNRVMAAIGRWQSARGGAMSRTLVAAELAPFLGTRGTDEVLHRVSESGDNLLDTVEPVLALFLGRQAAGKLVSQVVDRSLEEA